MSISSFFSRLWRILSPPRPGGTGAEEAAAAGEFGSGSRSTNAGSRQEDLEDDFDSELEAAFGGGADSATPSGSTGPSEHDRAHNRELFAGIAANHLRPVKDFVFELRAGTAPKEWIEVCRPVMASLQEAAESMELRNVSKLLKSLDGELQQAFKDQGPWPSRSWNERILCLYTKLEAAEPAAFAIDDADRRRDSIVIHSLLRQIPDVGYVTLEKLYRVGLTSEAILMQATPRELVETAGIPEELAARICDEMSSYRERIDGRSPEALRAGGLERLSERLPILRRYHEEFRQACDAAGVDRKVAARKATLRTKRRYCALEIEVILGEMGEVELARRVQQLAFEQRIKRLEQYLAEQAELQANANASDADRETSPTVAGT